MNQRTTLIAGSIFAGLAVAIGAFGAHGLKAMLTANQRVDTFELAVKYQFYHSLALLIAGLAMNWYGDRKLSYSSLFFSAGIIVFSGSLYALSLTGMTTLGAITPLGGLAFLIGWAVFIAAVAGKRRDL